MINLSVGHLEIDWCKSHMFSNHSQFFQPSDLTQVPYYYVDENELDENGDNLITEFKDGLSKPLVQVIDRVNLLGYTSRYAHQEFEFVSRLHGLDCGKFRFDDLAGSLARVDVQSISADYGEGEGFGRFFRRHIFDRLGFEDAVDDPHYVKFSAGEAMENLSASTILQLVTQNPLARSLPVSWQFADLESEGLAERDECVKPLDPSDRFLVVTEGSSDARIIEHALSLLKPHIADFFYFVDMDEGYPFTGTGNLFNFTKGLVSISIQNNVVIVYDNDAEGVSKFNRAVKLHMPDNLRVLKLPDLPELEKFNTVGPSGESISDINGCAASIECYLDGGPSATVQWNNFNKFLGVYHGELLGKRDIMKNFLCQSVVGENYDFSKIGRIVEMIVSECVAMRESARLASLE